MPPTAPESDLTGWAAAPFTGGGLTYDCYEKGSGPGVVLIPEAPGMTPEVLGLADHLVDQGFTVVIPSPFGEPGHAPTIGYTLRTVVRLCVAAEFRAFAIGAHRPITDFLRAVAADLAARTPGTGVGVIGMCFTGGFALAAAVDDSVSASVLSQPSVPFPISKARAQDPGLSPTELDRVAARADAGELCALGLRFSADRASQPARFATLKSRLGDAFEVIQLDSSPGNEWGFARTAHSVLTHEVRDEKGHPALEARSRVVEFLRSRLSR
ncbi:dienelactone hydrolase family protein [Frondihabitans sp. PhB188]|uniref:dienelactone hydrolase family protein n=1 Tax=Frondihabitans sp. PhB188 TaxID=2485200 RepID=UPI000F492D9B|nr:dienelactone hydrolase family protein [Frondihabitans sp. PhB188]